MNHANIVEPLQVCIKGIVNVFPIWLFVNSVLDGWAMPNHLGNIIIYILIPPVLVSENYAALFSGVLKSANFSDWSDPPPFLKIHCFYPPLFPKIHRFFPSKLPKKSATKFFGSEMTPPPSEVFRKFIQNGPRNCP